jgi:hypothetical protein
MNAALDALEENSNCQALYIQVRVGFCWAAFVSFEFVLLNPTCLSVRTLITP